MGRAVPPAVRSLSLLASLAAASALGACASGPGGGAGPYRTANLRPYEVNGRRYTPEAYRSYDAKGVASWYSYPSHTRKTATGEWYDPGLMTAAHKTLPLPCEVEVTNLQNGRKVRVRVNDRGPYADGRIIDLSRAAAEKLGFTRAGTTRVRVKLLGPAPLAQSDQIELAEAAPDDRDAAQLF
jgi:rare lipoprotein A